MSLELIENQRWYPILGWSSRLNADDPPSWCTPQQTETKPKDSFEGYIWNVYKSEDYDEEGWLYGTAFNGDLGPKTMSSVIRSRVWLGRTQEQVKLQALEKSMEAKKEQLTTKENEVPSTDLIQGTCINTEKNIAEEKSEESSNKSNETLTKVEELFPPPSEPSELFPSIATPELFPSPEQPELFPCNENSAPSSNISSSSSSSSIIGRFSAAAFSLPSSAMKLAGNSSRQAVIGTVQSLKEVSLYAFESAQAVTTAAITSEPVVPTEKLAGHQILSQKKDPHEMLSMLSKKFPDLTPVDRSLVTCCISETPKHLSPPECSVRKHCKVCGDEFGLRRFRYVCGYCSESFCRDDLPHTEIIRAFGHTIGTKICTICHIVLTQKIDQQLIQWRVERVVDFLKDQLILYFNTSTDTAVDKILRAAEGTLAAAKAAPMGATAKMAVVSADFIRKYGRAGLLGFILRNEFMQSFTTLKGLIGDLDDLGFQDAALGIYYFMAMNRGDRGAKPEAEKEAHQTCPNISDELLQEMLKYAPLALHAIYQQDVLDIQRISKHQGFQLIYAHVQSQDVRHPSFALLGNKSSKIALVLIRGSKSVQDLLTDIQAHPEEISKEAGTNGFVDAFAHNGMLKAAMWIKDRIVLSLRKLDQEGFQIIFAGHSLGAGCAALMSIMLQKEFVGLKCFAYAVPACVNWTVAESCCEFVHSIVLRDDFVPRAKASNILKLCQELKDFRNCWKDTITEDVDAFKERAKTLWAPRKREWAIHEADKKKGNVVEVNLKKNIQPKENDVTMLLSEMDVPVISDESNPSRDVSSWTLTRGNLIEKMDTLLTADEKQVTVELEKKKKNKKKKEEEEKEEEEEEEKEEEDPKELYIPGKVTHLYFHKGIYEAVHLDRKCIALSHIPVYQNMLSDHNGRNYLDALRTVRDFRRMKPTLPSWVPFSTKTRCMCCDSPFTWNSTSQSEAQQNLDQHNCRRCGWLVCEGCSEKFKSIPEFGINIPVRVCDRCYYEL